MLDRGSGTDGPGAVPCPTTGAIVQDRSVRRLPGRGSPDAPQLMCSNPSVRRDPYWAPIRGPVPAPFDTEKDGKVQTNRSLPAEAGRCFPGPYPSRTKSSLPKTDHLGAEELAALIKVAEQRLSVKREETKSEMLVDMRVAVEKAGFDFDELVGRNPAAGRRKRTDVALKLSARYRGRNGEIYKGPGPTPKWLKDLERKGVNRKNSGSKAASQIRLAADWPQMRMPRPTSRVRTVMSCVTSQLR